MSKVRGCAWGLHKAPLEAEPQYFRCLQIQALQFEWAWQHPEKSKAVRDDVAALVASCKRAGLSGAKGKVSGSPSY